MITCAVILIATGAPMAGAPGDDPKVNLYRDDKGGIHCSWSESVTSAITRKIRIDVPQRGSVLATESIRDTSGGANAEVEVTLPTDPRTPYKIRIVTTPFTGVRIAGPVIPAGIEEMLRINGGNPSALKKVHDLLEAGGPLLASRDFFKAAENDQTGELGLGGSNRSGGLLHSSPTAKTFTSPTSVIPHDGRSSEGGPADSVSGAKEKKSPDLSPPELQPGTKTPNGTVVRSDTQKNGVGGTTTTTEYVSATGGHWTEIRSRGHTAQTISVEQSDTARGTRYVETHFYQDGRETGVFQLSQTPDSSPTPNNENPDEGTVSKWTDPQILEMLTRFGQGMKPRVDPTEFTSPSSNPGKNNPEGNRKSGKKTPRGAGTDPRDDIQGANRGSRRGARWWAGCPKGWDGVGPPPRGN